MADLIKHRGPDSEGFYTNDKVALGFRRLSIIDLEGGNQPIFNEDQTKLVFMNGEIYNYQLLKEDLLAKGHHFTTDSDTEVLLHGYEEYKEDFLLMLRGMFAFVIYDVVSNELFGARDFYGIKPFYYYLNKKQFIFGSEIKSFLGHPNFKKELNRNMLEDYLTFQYSVGEETFFKNVYKLQPGHYFKYKDHNLTIKKYYSIAFEPDNKKSEHQWQKTLKEILNDSIKAHKHADVEVGSFLSSGVDSSFISTVAHVDKTFTVGWDNQKYSEIDYAKELSQIIGVKNTNKKISKKEYFDHFAHIQYYMDEPLADPSAIALYFVANIASKEVKVALSGEGSDEIFGGYNIYHEPFSLSFYYKIPYPIRRLLGILIYPLRHHRGFNFIYRRSLKLEERYIGNAFMFEPSETKQILNYKPQKENYKRLTKPYYNKVKAYDDVSKMQYIDFNFWLVGDILLKADKMSMANSLEVRVPFLDRLLIDTARKIPTKYKIKDGKTKYLFREVAREVLPQKWSDKKKLGFPVPIREWLKEDDIYNLIKNKFLESEEFFKPNKIIKLLDQHKKGKRDNSRKIWTIYSFLVWYEEYFIKR